MIGPAFDLPRGSMPATADLDRPRTPAGSLAVVGPYGAEHLTLAGSRVPGTEAPIPSSRPRLGPFVLVAANERATGTPTEVFRVDATPGLAALPPRYRGVTDDVRRDGDDLLVEMTNGIAGEVGRLRFARDGSGAVRKTRPAQRPSGLDPARSETWLGRHVPGVLGDPDMEPRPLTLLGGAASMPDRCASAPPSVAR